MEQNQAVGPEFDLAFIKNNQQIVLRQFKGETIGDRVITEEDLRHIPLQALLAHDFQNLADLQGVIPDLGRHYPVRTQEETGLSLENFEQLGALDAQKVVRKINSQWETSANLNLLENLFPIITRLKGLWPNDRNTFFEELWYLLRANLGARTLIMLYNGISESNEKLVKIKVEGEVLPNSTAAAEVDLALWSHYEAEMGPNFSNINYQAGKGDWVSSASIMQSPVLIMAKIHQYNPLQKALLKSLFDGLSHA